MIKVCDAIMGSGKSSAAINYMNTHKDQRFIFITPYLDEADRIFKACPELDFQIPDNTTKLYGYRKYTHTLKLLENKKNIVSTHAMFMQYKSEMIDIIKNGEYTLIIDEAVNTLQAVPVPKGDFKIFEQLGWVQREGRHITITPTFDYNGKFVSDGILLTGDGSFLDLSEDGKKSQKDCYYLWTFPTNILNAFKDVIILTYLFEGQTMNYYFQVNNIQYKNIGVHKTDNGDYEFVEDKIFMPEYVKNLSSLIHIFENKKLNAIGDDRCALSNNWYKSSAGNNKGKRDVLRRNINNFFMQYNKDKSYKYRLWSTFKCAIDDLKDQGFLKCHLSFNSKAINTYRDRCVLAYCVNIFMKSNEKIYLSEIGVDVHEDLYALSVMLQWIWRSAIRDGKEIWIYIPSSRMRNLLKEWIAKEEQAYKDLYNTAENGGEE